MAEFNLNPDGTFMGEGQILADIVAHRLQDDMRRMLAYGFTPPRSMDDWAMIRTTGFDPDRYARFQFGMWIRNSYGLWDPKNPHAQKHGDTSFVIDGIDHHPRHPDAISGRVIDELVLYARAAGWEKLAAETIGAA